MFEQIISNGGPTLYPLALLSVLAFAVFMERGIYFLRNWTDYRALINGIRAEWKGLRAALPEFLEQDKRPLYCLARLQLFYSRKCPHLRNDILKREGERLLSQSFRFVRFLGLTASIAPLLGLAGTVLGLVDTFYLIELKGGQVNPSELAGGIWEALLTTVLGLAIAIPSMLAYHFFSGICEQQARNMKSLVSEIDEIQHLNQEGICDSQSIPSALSPSNSTET